MANITRIKASDSKSNNTPKDRSLTEDTPKNIKSETRIMTEPSKANATQPKIKHSSKVKNDIQDSKLDKKFTKLEKAQQKYEKKQAKKQAKLAKKTNKKPMPKALRILTAPFRKIGTYIRESWQELRQVRWPNRKMTWKLVSAVIVYTIVFAVFIMLLDVGFTLLFNNLLK